MTTRLATLFVTLLTSMHVQAQTNEIEVVARLITPGFGSKIHIAEYEILEVVSGNPSNDTIWVGYLFDLAYSIFGDTAWLSLSKYTGQDSVRDYYMLNAFDTPYPGTLKVKEDSVMTEFIAREKKDRDNSGNSFFTLHLDSLEQRVIERKRDTVVRHYVHYTITNTAKSNLIFMTNSCFYYNHYSLVLNGDTFDLNPYGDCLMNSRTTYNLLPGESFSTVEDVSAKGLDKFQIGLADCTLTIPVVNEHPGIYAIDGRDFITNSKNLKFTGKTELVKTRIKETKRKKD